MNLSLAGQFGARRAPVGLAAGPRAALAGLPLVVRPRLAARTLAARTLVARTLVARTLVARTLVARTLVARTLVAPFALATELRARQGLNLRAQAVTLALDLLQPLAQGFAPGLQPAVLDPQGRHRATLARIDTDGGKKRLKTIDLRAQMQRILRRTAQVLRFRTRRLERVPGPTPLRFPVPRLAVRLDLLPFEPFGTPVHSIRAALLFLVKPGPDLRSARRTRNRARRHRVQCFLKTWHAYSPGTCRSKLPVKNESR